MTTSKSTSHRLLSASLIAALGVAIAACGGDDEPTERPRADASTAPPSTSDASTPTEDSSTPAPGATCEEQVYSELSPACKTCVCTKNEMSAPSCQGPCWDFLACSFKVRAGKCAESFAGGDATRAQFEMCTLTECGTYLSVPGAQAITGYRETVKACVDGATLPCMSDVTKFGAGLK